MLLQHSLLARPNTAAAVEAERNVMQKIVASRSVALHEVRQKVAARALGTSRPPTSPNISGATQVTQIEGLLAQHARNEDAQALEELLLDQCEAERAAHQALHVSELRLSAAREDAHAAQRAARAAKDVAIADEEELSAAQAALDTAVSEEKSARAEVQRLHAAQLGEGDGSRLPSWLAAEGSSDEEEDEEDGEGEDKGSGNLARPSVSSEDVAARVQQLREAMSEAELEVQTARRKRAELERTHGTLGCLQEQLHARGAHASRAQALVELQRKEETVTRSIATLTEGIQEMRVRVAAANREAFVAVRAGCIQNFHTLVPAMELDVRGEGNGEPAEGNARFWIRNRAVEACGDGPACGGNAWRGGLAELSGGQRTLLNISLLLAVAKFRPSSLLLLDEVDAALDEHNASRVAALLKGLSIHSQEDLLPYPPALHHQLYAETSRSPHRSLQSATAKSSIALRIT
ncbi:hypothetical protein AB1Y20_005844 [Prymnesium parvum]|uniref:RecF/RecN/SMC N-terminal domain-containing protein n=1 Tax=Prymnesium parvum TaxID=97485 RepID=A0AB34J2S2_PRYPA